MFESLFQDRGLSLDRLRTLAEVSRAGSIVGAAPGDASRQSLFSRQIKELEEFFGVSLAYRAGRKLKLTKEGRELVAVSNEFFVALGDFRRRTKNAACHFIIGSGESLLAWLVAPALSSPELRGQQASLSYRNMRSREVTGALIDMEIDLGILRRDALPSSVLESREAPAVSYALYVPREMMPEKADFEWLIRNRPVVSLDETTAFYKKLSGNLAGAGLQITSFSGTPSFTCAASMMKSRAFAAILPDLAEIDLDESFVRVEHPLFHALHRDLVIAWNPRLLRVRPGVERFINAFHEAIRKRGGVT